jgi:hypothetical protein
MKSENARPASNPFVYVNVVADPLTVWLFVYAQQIVYDAIPELSFDAVQASDTLYGVTPVTRKFVGAVGELLSRPPARAGDGPTTAVRIRARAAVAAADNAGLPDILAPPDHSRGGYRGVPTSDTHAARKWMTR